MLNGSSPKRPILEQNLKELEDRIEAACDRCHRSTGEVTVVAVTKYTTPAIMAELVRLGIHDLGESRIQNALEKVPEVRGSCPKPLRWHLIGHLQTNKARKAIELFDLVHSVDSLRLARGLQRAAQAVDRPVDVLLQVNVSGEESKHGFSADELLRELPELQDLPGLRIQGLMTMAPFSEDSQESRPTFAGLRHLRDDLRTRTGWGLDHLSMGMTQDFEVAIEEGATLVRVGSLLLRGT